MRPSLAVAALRCWPFVEDADDSALHAAAASGADALIQELEALTAP